MNKEERCMVCSASSGISRKSDHVCGPANQKANQVAQNCTCKQCHELDPTESHGKNPGQWLALSLAKVLHPAQSCQLEMWAHCQLHLNYSTLLTACVHLSFVT